MAKLGDGFFGRKDKRSAARRSLGSDAWIRIGGVATRSCVVSDVSLSDVRLIVDASVPVPKDFELITTKGTACRKCTIKWRNATQRAGPGNLHRTLSGVSA